MIDKVEINIYVRSHAVTGFGQRVAAPEANVEIREASGDAEEIAGVITSATACADLMLKNLQERS